MEKTFFSEKSIDFQRNTQRYISEARAPNTQFHVQHFYKLSAKVVSSYQGLFLLLWHSVNKLLSRSDTLSCI
jgi:hypothetical protein